MYEASLNPGYAAVDERFDLIAAALIHGLIILPEHATPKKLFHCYDLVCSMNLVGPPFNLHAMLSHPLPFQGSLWPDFWVSLKQVAAICALVCLFNLAEVATFCTLTGLA